jgi:hypothetical protein
MYNELFKMLDELGEEHLQAYWLETSRQAKMILGMLIEEKGLQGMYEYWDRIRFEENCDMDLILEDDRFELHMNACSSLKKNLDNDAGLCMRYCDHCSGWISPLIKSYGYYPVYDMISRTEPRCVIKIFCDEKQAREAARHAKLLADPYKYYSS